MIERGTLWWISLAACTSGGIVLLPLYYELPSWIGMALLGVAALVGVGAVRCESEPMSLGVSWRTAVFLALPAGFAAYYAAGGVRAALFLLVCGVATAALAPRRRMAQRLAGGAVVVGTMAIAQAAAAHLYGILLGDAHGTTLLASLDRWLFRAVGRATTVIGRTVYIETATGPIAVVPSWDQLGLVCGLIALAGFAVLVLGSAGVTHRIRALLRGTGIIAAFLLIRRVILVLIALETGSPRLFWNPATLVVSMLPLIVLLALFSGVHPRGVGPRLRAAFVPGRGGIVLAVGGAAFAATWLVLAALYLVPAGPRNEGTILFDEAHGDWESTRIAMDTETYGLATTYNYASLYDWLAYYYPVNHLTEPIRGDLLDGCSTLVLKTPSSPYSAEEIETIGAFVRAGGGLFVIGDHTNVFGTTTVLNPVLEQFGLALNFDSTYRLNTGSFTIYKPGHSCYDPIMQHVARFDFLTSCSIRAPLHAYRTIADNRILANQADYGTRDFFPKDRYTLRSEFGRFVQTAAVLHGAGRVVLFADSTCFSNFSVFMDGYPSFLLGTFGFLSHRNVGGSLRILFLVAAGLAIATLGLVRWRRCGGGAVALVCGVLLGWAVFCLSAGILHRSMYPLQEPSDGIPLVYFDIEHSDIEIEPQPASSKTYDRTRQYDTFFVWSQRVAKIPQLTDSASRDEVLPQRPYVIINPDDNMDSVFLSWVHEYVASGGALIVLDRCGRDPRGADQLLAQFELSIEEGCGSDRVIRGTTVTEREISPSLTLSVSIVSVGDGSVVLVSDSSPFSNLSLGGAFVVPSPIQQALYDTVFWLFEDAISAAGP